MLRTRNVLPEKLRSLGFRLPDMWSEYDRLRVEQISSRVSRDFWMPLISGHIEESLRAFMSSRSFLNLSVPLLNEAYTPKRSVLVFEHKGKSLELSPSGAMHIGALSAIYGRVYSLQAVFRDEGEYDANHLTEFHMLEAEWQCMDYEELLCFLEELLCFCMKEFNAFVRAKGITGMFPEHDTGIFPLKRVNYSEVPQDSEQDPEGMYDRGIDSCRHAPYFIMFYPPRASWRAKVISEKQAYTFNLVLPGEFGELAECSVRETLYNIMQEKFRRAGLDEKLGWYSEALRANQQTRCGFGLGIERLNRWLMNADDTAHTKAFSRTLS